MNPQIPKMGKAGSAAKKVCYSYVLRRVAPQAQHLPVTLQVSGHGALVREYFAHDQES
jgi:hypothetical protein